MIIGFLDSEVTVLEEFKECIKAHKYLSYVAYIDTRGGPYAKLKNKELSLALKIGCAWLTKKGATVIAVRRNYLQTVREIKAAIDLPPVDLVEIETLGEYLQALMSPATEPSPSRIIHLTEHSKESDNKMVEILGGYFIAQK